jgi:hypothetical protein
MDMNCLHFLLTEQRQSSCKAVRNNEIESRELTIYYDMQCPCFYQNIVMIKQHCEMNDVPVSLIQVDTLQKAKQLPCVFNNRAVFYKENFETVNLLNVDYLKRILKNENNRRKNVII